MRSTHARPRPLGLAAFLSTLATSLVATPSVAQNALDAPSGVSTALSPQAIRSQTRGAVGGGRGGLVMPNGNALDANLGVYSGGMNAPAARTDYNARNLIVTNSVAGGRGFRGSVGYRADTDFRATVGSDALYRWDAYSAESNPVWVQTVRSSDQFQIAQGIGQFEFRRPSTVLPTGSTPQSLASQPDSRLRLDRQNSALNIGSVVQLNSQPVEFAQGTDFRNNPVNYYVSPMQGLRMEKVDDPLAKSGLSLFEKAVAREDMARGKLEANLLQDAFVSPLSRSAATGSRIEPMPIGDAAASDAYDRIVRDVVRAYADAPNVNVDADPRIVDEVRKELEALRGTLRGTSPKPTGDRPKMDATPDPTAMPEPGIDPMTGLPARPEAKAETPKEGDAAATADDDREEIERELLNAEKIRQLAENLRHGGKVADLSPGERARVDQLVRTGQDNLAAGDFFAAERSFADALALNPGNPLLIAGLGNSQLGAGLYLSSALSFRELFTSYPEMIDTRYEVRLLPKEERLRQAVGALRIRIAGKTDADSFGLLLAYVGHQLENRALVTEGLGEIVGNPANDTLRLLLQEVWLGDGKAPASK